MIRTAAPFALALAAMLPGCSLVPAAEAAGGESAGNAAVRTISVADLATMIEAGEVVLVDVRTPGEFAEARLAGALNAPLSTFDPASIPREDHRETILYCRSSRRSEEAAVMLANDIGGTVRHLEGGIVAWQEAGPGNTFRA